MSKLCGYTSFKKNSWAKNSINLKRIRNVFIINLRFPTRVIRIDYTFHQQKNERRGFYMSLKNKFHLEPCRLPVWASNGHLQTIAGHLLRHPPLENKGKRVEISTSDNDKLIGFITNGSSDTVVYLFHGLAGNTDSNYMHRVARVAQNLGHTVIMVNHRGCGEGLGFAVGPYHSGRAEDLSAAIEAGRKMFPQHRHLAVGFSMSANALLLLLSGKRGTVKPDLAVCMNAPIHLESCAHALKRGFNRIYDIEFLRLCRRDVFRAKGIKLNMPIWGTLHDFDNLYTAPAGGFKNREDYYESCSTWNLLGEIRTPTIVLTAKDDPFVPVEYYEKAQPSSFVHMHIEQFGGHMGYISRDRTPLGTHRWLDYSIHEAIRYVLTFPAPQ
jgi:predicted alpha/beta-fold hydrolase